MAKDIRAGTSEKNKHRQETVRQTGERKESQTDRQTKGRLICKQTEKRQTGRNEKIQTDGQKQRQTDRSKE